MHQRRLFWLGLAAISVICSLMLPLVSGFIVTSVAGFVWWWVVFRSGHF